MKKITSIGLMMIFALSISFIGCKKGANDPFISLKSRDGRITGTWDLSKVDKSDVWAGNSSSTTATETYDGTTWTTTNFLGTSTTSYSYEVTIEKDGTWSSIEITDGDTEEDSGTWYWMDSKKDKTGLFVANDFWNIDQLKNKELITINNTYDKSTDDNGNYSENTGTDTRTYTKK